LTTQQIDYTPLPADLPREVSDLINHADALWEQFWAQKLNKRYPRYVASEPAQVYAALKHVRDEGLALGDRFIEWGSGFGVASQSGSHCLDSKLPGIELEEGLVEIAESLAEKHQTGAEFIATTYIPEGYISYDHVGGSDIVPDDSFRPPSRSTPL
jgi:hypothetical protein